MKKEEKEIVQTEGGRSLPFIGLTGDHRGELSQREGAGAGGRFFQDGGAHCRIFPGRRRPW